MQGPIGGPYEISAGEEGRDINPQPMNGVRGCRWRRLNPSTCRNAKLKFKTLCLVQTPSFLHHDFLMCCTEYATQNIIIAPLGVDRLESTAWSRLNISMNAVFEKNQHNDVIRVASYHRADFDVTVIGSSSSEHDPIRSSIEEPFPSAALSSLGSLECLPVELLWTILLELDIRSYVNLRQTNRRARQVASSIHKYRVVIQHALESFRAVLRTGISPRVTISDLYRVLCARGCALCGNEFGGHLFLPSVARCCFACIESSTHLRVVSVSTLSDIARSARARISRRKLNGLLPVLRTVPGIYTMEQRTRKRRIAVVSQEQAVEALRFFGIASEDAAFIISKTSAVPMGSHMVSTALPVFDPATAEIERGVSCKGCQIAVEVPQGNPPVDLYTRRDKVYSKQGYLDHFPECPQSISLWESSKGGTIAVDEPEFTRRRGYLT